MCGCPTRDGTLVFLLMYIHLLVRVLCQNVITCIYEYVCVYTMLTTVITSSPAFWVLQVVTRQCKLWTICNWHRCHHCDSFFPPHPMLSAFFLRVRVFNQTGVGLLHSLRHIDTNVHSCTKQGRVTEMAPHCTNTTWDCSFSERKCCSWRLAYNPTAFPAQHSTFLRSQQVVGAVRMRENLRISVVGAHRDMSEPGDAALLIKWWKCSRRCWESSGHQYGSYRNWTMCALLQSFLLRETMCEVFRFIWLVTWACWCEVPMANLE